MSIRYKKLNKYANIKMVKIMNKEENFKKFALFFKYDLAIKKELIKLKYPDENNLTDEDLFKYYDLLVSGIQEIRRYFLQMVKSLGWTSEEKVINKFFDNLDSELKNMSYNYNKLKSFYINRLSDMREEFIETVNYDNIGYTMHFGTDMHLAKTVNEMLHAIHKYVINNESILQNLPIQEVVKRPFSITSPYDGYTITGEDNYTLYGDDNELAKDILHNLDIKSNAGVTDIVAINSSQKIIMMVRDKGHALSIEIDIGDDDKCLVNYFIPKVCNPEIVNTLPGVRKVNNASQFTDGKFLANKEELPKMLDEFIKRVPTDLEMTEEWIYTPKK